MAQGRETCGDEGGRGGGAGGNADAFEGVGLAGLGHALVLDVGFDGSEELEAGVDVGRGLLESREEGGDLLLHGGLVLLWCVGMRGVHEAELGCAMFVWCACVRVVVQCRVAPRRGTCPPCFDHWFHRQPP